ncbi:MAG: hypothetical protein HYZ13_05260 [Acidobacteria bacterium]|nr:hypothetical protein [Acidobacteriota bacterium]
MPLAALLLAAYAWLRYGWASPGGPMGPAFLANKVLAMLALGALGRALAHRDVAVRARAGRAGIGLLLAHLALSPALLAPERYPKLYAHEAFTAACELALLAGALGAALLLRLHGPWTASHQRQARVALALATLHLGALGASGWLRPAAWPAGLPPLSLVGFLYGSFILADPLHRLRRPRRFPQATIPIQSAAPPAAQRMSFCPSQTSHWTAT